MVGRGERSEGWERAETGDKGVDRLRQWVGCSPTPQKKGVVTRRHVLWCRPGTCAVGSEVGR